MTNLIKMNLYRLVRTVSAWVILVLVILMAAFSAYNMKMDNMKMDYDLYTGGETGAETEADVSEGLSIEAEGTAEYDEEMSKAEQVEQGSFGIFVNLPGEGDAGVADYLMSDLVSGLQLMFAMIFVVLFVNAEAKSGYIKNIVRAKKGKCRTIVAKFMVVALYSIFLLLVYSVVYIVMIKAFLNPGIGGFDGEFALFMLCYILLYAAFVVFVSVLTELLKSSTLSITVGMFDMFGFSYIISNVITVLTGSESFKLYEYLLIPGINSLVPGMTGRVAAENIILAMAWMAACLALCMAVSKKRDVV